MVCTELAVSIPFDDVIWMNIVDHYFDNIHWNQPTKKYNKPADWVLDKYGADIDLNQRQIHFDSREKCSWFVLTWGQ
jgi:hypothetical protein